MVVRFLSKEGEELAIIGDTVERSSICYICLAPVVIMFSIWLSVLGILLCLDLFYGEPEWNSIDWLMSLITAIVAVFGGPVGVISVLGRSVFGIRMLSWCYRIYFVTMSITFNDFCFSWFIAANGGTQSGLAWDPDPFEISCALFYTFSFCLSLAIMTCVFTPAASSLRAVIEAGGSGWRIISAQEICANEIKQLDERIVKARKMPDFLTILRDSIHTNKNRFKVNTDSESLRSSNSIRDGVAWGRLARMGSWVMGKGAKARQHLLVYAEDDLKGKDLV